MNVKVSLKSQPLVPYVFKSQYPKSSVYIAMIFCFGSIKVEIIIFDCILHQKFIT